MPFPFSDRLTYALAALAIVACMMFGARVPATVVARVERVLAHRLTPVLAALLSALAIFWVAGSLDPVAVYHDERAYVLQAELFAHGRWTGLAAPIPEFFTQLHVFVTPYLAAKYPLGNSLLLAPGAFVGAPALMVVLLGALAGGLVFALARRVANGLVAVVTWLVWLAPGPVLGIRAGYMSQVSTAPLWLVTWYAVLRYRDDNEPHRARWLMLAVAAVAVCAIVRPLTAVALAVPCAVVLIRRVHARHEWNLAAQSLAVGIAILCLLPLQNVKTTGDWRTSPLVTYTRTVTPFDFPTFGYDETRPIAPLPTDLNRARQSLIFPRVLHTPQNLIWILPTRVAAIARVTWSDWRLPLVLFAVLGLFRLPVAARVAAWSALLLYVVHVMHAHNPWWTLFYHEMVPVLAFATALGFAKVVVWFRARSRRTGESGLAPTADGAVRGSLILAAAAMLIITPFEVARTRERLDVLKRPQRLFRDAVASIPEAKAIVFVRYPASASGHLSLVGNPPDYGTARAWLVYDRGPENAKLSALAPDRVAYYYDAGYGTLERGAAH